MATQALSLRAALLGGALALATLSGCDAVTGGGAAPTADAEKGAAVTATETPASDLDPVLASPQVGDIYAAELTAFSSYDFNEGAPERAGQKSYGLMKVVEVSDDRITVVTESAAWPQQSGALSDLRGTMADITWDDNERIPINRADLAKHVDDGKIIETRRMSAG
jgi:hypothetical protein